MVEQSFIIAMLVLFFHTCFQDGMIFGFVSRLLSIYPSWFKKPVYDCATCMCMWWGWLGLTIGIHWLGWQRPTFIGALIILATAAGINAAISYMRTGKKCDCERQKRLGII